MKNSHLTVALAVLALMFVGVFIVLWSRISEIDGNSSHVRAASLESSDIERKKFPIEDFMCPRANWCAADFTRLAAHPEALVGKRIFILGYLAVDGGVVSLFASEEDYLRMEEGRSLEIGGNRSDLSALFEAHGNRYVRIEGTYEFPPVGRGRSARLGVLEPPIVARAFHPRARTQGVDEILVRIRYQ